jgi:hypothetical protein
LIEKVTGEAEAEKFCEVFPENWDSVKIFLRLGTQWNYAGMGSRTGLIYKSIEVLMSFYEVKDKVAMFEDILIIEAAILELEAKENAKGG